MHTSAALVAQKSVKHTERGVASVPRREHLLHKHSAYSRGERGVTPRAHTVADKGIEPVLAVLKKADRISAKGILSARHHRTLRVFNAHGATCREQHHSSAAEVLIHFAIRKGPPTHTAYEINYFPAPTVKHPRGFRLEHNSALAVAVHHRAPHSYLRLAEGIAELLAQLGADLKLALLAAHRRRKEIRDSLVVKRKYLGLVAKKKLSCVKRAVVIYLIGNIGQSFTDIPYRTVNVPLVYPSVPVDVRTHRRHAAYRFGIIFLPTDLSVFAVSATGIKGVIAYLLDIPRKRLSRSLAKLTEEF